MLRKVYGPTAVVLLAAALRFWELASVPPGLFYDESVEGVDALRVLAGAHPIYFTGNQGREPLYVYAQAVVIALIGPSPFAIRLTSAFLGVLTVAATYATFRALAGRSVALIGSFLLAVLYWHVSLSRVGFRAVSLPLFLTLAIFWLLKGTRTGRLRYFALAGALLGLDVYTYIPARLAVVLVALWLVGCVLIRSWRKCSMSRAAVGALVASALFVVVVLPLGRYFYLHPRDFWGRIQATARKPADATAILQGFAGAGTALVWSGDSNARQDLPGRPLLDASLTAAGLLGGVLAVRRWRDGASVPALCWLAAMVLPAALSDEPAHALRLVGELPMILFLPAVGLAGIARVRWAGRRIFGTAIVGVVLTVAAVSTARDYFDVWATRPLTYDAFQADLLHALSLLSQVPPGAGVLAATSLYEDRPIPLSVVRDADASSDVRGFDGRFVSVVPARDQTRPVYVLYARSYVPSPGVPDRDRLAIVGRSDDPFQQVDGELFRVDPGFGAPLPERSIAAVIASAVQVIGSDVPTVLHPGQAVRFSLYWTVRGSLPPGNWVYFAHLVSRDRHQVLAQQYNDGFPAAEWRSGDRVVSWFDLPVPADAPAGVVEVGAGILDRDDGRRLPVSDPSGKSAGDTVLVGPLRIDRPAAAPSAEHALAATFGAGIDLDGYDLQRDATGAWTLRLHWHADRPITGDYTVFVHLLDASGREIANADAEPGQGAFPTSTWAPGEPVLDPHRLQVPAGGPVPARIEFGVYLLATGQRLAASSPDGAPLGDSIALPL